MVRSFLALVVLSACALTAQEVCQPVPIYSPCEIVFELENSEKAAHSNPYASVRIQAELRSPRHRTIALPAFWDGAGRLVIRFAPTDPGDWEFRITSNIRRLEGKLGKVTALDADVPGFIKPANGHHWIHTHNRQPHLWMGETSLGLARLEKTAFDQLVDQRAQQGFNHIRAHASGAAGRGGAAFSGPDQPDIAFYQLLDSRVRQANAKGIFVDLILGDEAVSLAKLFPSWQQRERFLKYMVARYSAFHVTWQIAQPFDDDKDARELLKQLGLALKQADPYGHPRTAATVSTSSPLAQDGWMDYIAYRSSDDQLGSIEHQLYALPAVNENFGYEQADTGSANGGVDSATFRKRLWNAAMNGQYPTFGHTALAGATAFDAQLLASQGAKAMSVWREFTAKTRYWELEPYFDLDGGRAMALPGVEYIVYIEKVAGPVEVRVEKHEYDVRWLNPSTGEVIPARNFKSERYVAEPPDTKQDWVLHLSRDGRKEGMLRSYKFESRPFLMQEIEASRTRAPFDIAEPAADQVSQSMPASFGVKAKRESRGTRAMMYLWTGEVGTTGMGMRVLGTGPSGILRIPKAFAPGTMNVRVYGMNALGKVYTIDRIYQVAP